MTMTFDPGKDVIARLRHLYDDRPVAFALGLIALLTVLIIIGWSLVSASGLGWWARLGKSVSRC
ncbi:hypothetical protein QWJ06_05415 [Kocuria rhizophila]|uniref:hypothetical protein n=1 Tax=Kocuria rhizophila TaxID=72000 RepID=UPI001ABE604E|nr:hypothetical protein [Kocuria rhizophila]MBO4145966.1 hypothetical protein [Kocuria rhizophila]MDN3226155.1 hypothetical protein [Kocuria rhizophila]QTK32191.1 hypothetical protein J5U48_03475 [Kocuria rhizophila]